MTTQEDNGTVENQEVITEQAPEVISEEQVPEVISEENQEVVDEKVNNLSEQDITDLLNAITDGINEDKVEEIPSRPTNFEEKPNEELDDEDFVTEEELDKTLDLIDLLDSENESKDVQIQDLNTQISELNTKLEEEIQKQSAIEDIWSQITSHPIIGPFALKIAKGESPDIPDILQKQLQNEIDSMPSIENTDQVSIKPEIETAADRIMNTKTW